MQSPSLNSSSSPVKRPKGKCFRFSLKSHHVIKGKQGKKSYQCDVCSGMYRHAFSLKRHYLRTHINYSFLSEADIANCNISTRRLPSLAESSSQDSPLKSPSLLLEESIEEEDAFTAEDMDKSKLSEVYRCHLCKNLFDTSLDLKEHISHHSTSATQSQFDCDHCEMTFSHKQNLVRHMSVHSQCYACKYCSKPFSSRTNKKRHERLHEGLKPYQCNFCSLAFSQTADLRKHVKQIHATHYHPCDKCTKYFFSLTLLEQHLMTNHTEADLSIPIPSPKKENLNISEEHANLSSSKPLDSNNIPCPICQKNFSSHVNMSRHKRLAHRLPKGIKPSKKDVYRQEYSRSPFYQTESEFYQSLAQCISENLLYFVDGKYSDIEKNYDYNDDYKEIHRNSSFAGSFYSCHNGELITDLDAYNVSSYNVQNSGIQITDNAITDSFSVKTVPEASPQKAVKLIGRQVPMIYICSVCASRHKSLEEIESHKLNNHINVDCTHIEIEGDESSVPPGLCQYYTSPIGNRHSIETPVYESYPMICSKCKSKYNKTADFHAHILECAKIEPAPSILSSTPVKASNRNKFFNNYSTPRTLKMTDIRKLLKKFRPTSSAKDKKSSLVCMNCKTVFGKYFVYTSHIKKCSKSKLHSPQAPKYEFPKIRALSDAGDAISNAGYKYGSTSTSGSKGSKLSPDCSETQVLDMSSSQSPIRRYPNLATNTIDGSNRKKISLSRTLQKQDVSSAKGLPDGTQQSRLEDNTNAKYEAGLKSLKKESTADVGEVQMQLDKIKDDDLDDVNIILKTEASFTNDTGIKPAIKEPALVNRSNKKHRLEVDDKKISEKDVPSKKLKVVHLPDVEPLPKKRPGRPPKIKPKIIESPPPPLLPPTIKQDGEQLEDISLGTWEDAEKITPKKAPKNNLGTRQISPNFRLEKRQVRKTLSSEFYISLEEEELDLKDELYKSPKSLQSSKPTRLTPTKDNSWQIGAKSQSCPDCQKIFTYRGNYIKHLSKGCLLKDKIQEISEQQKPKARDSLENEPDSSRSKLDPKSNKQCLPMETCKSPNSKVLPEIFEKSPVNKKLKLFNEEPLKDAVLKKSSHDQNPCESKGSPSKVLLLQKSEALDGPVSIVQNSNISKDDSLVLSDQICQTSKGLAIMDAKLGQPITNSLPIKQQNCKTSKEIEMTDTLSTLPIKKELSKEPNDSLSTLASAQNCEASKEEAQIKFKSQEPSVSSPMTQGNSESSVNDSHLNIPMQEKCEISSDSATESSTLPSESSNTSVEPIQDSLSSLDSSLKIIDANKNSTNSEKGLVKDAQSNIQTSSIPATPVSETSATKIAKVTATEAVLKEIGKHLASKSTSSCEAKPTPSSALVNIQQEPVKEKTLENLNAAGDQHSNESIKVEINQVEEAPDVKPLIKLESLEVKSELHSCNVCQRTFTYLANYRKHMKESCVAKKKTSSNSSKKHFNSTSTAQLLKIEDSVLGLIREQSRQKEIMKITVDSDQASSVSSSPSSPARRFNTFSCNQCHKIFLSYIQLLKHRLVHAIGDNGQTGSPDSSLHESADEEILRKETYASDSIEEENKTPSDASSASEIIEEEDIVKNPSSSDAKSSPPLSESNKSRKNKQHIKTRWKKR